MDKGDELKYLLILGKKENKKFTGSITDYTRLLNFKGLHGYARQIVKYFIDNGILTCNGFDKRKFKLYSINRKALNTMLDNNDYFHLALKKLGDYWKWELKYR